MAKQLVFSFVLLLTLAVFLYTARRLWLFFRLTKGAFPVRDTLTRIRKTFSVAFGQSKIFRRPLTGLAHALVFWGFLIILFGSIEMIIDGLSGKEKTLSMLGGFYEFMMASGDVFALVVTLCVLYFLFRRIFLNIKRFKGMEMKHQSHLDAKLALLLILMLMLSLTGMNVCYLKEQFINGEAIKGNYPFSALLAGLIINIRPQHIHFWHEFNWWAHILLIFLFANILPYSKHFHVFMSIPNVYLSRTGPPGRLYNMESVMQEVRMMLDPSVVPGPAAENVPARFGVKDIEDVSWKNYLDSLACTECGRCTSVCPANITGKKLSPRKIIMDVRARMKEKGPGLIVIGKDYDDKRALLRNMITEEELWACTTCNACAEECPVCIDHPSLIVDMRRYLVMEEGSAPAGLKGVFNNIENNGAPWQFSSEDRLLWAAGLTMNKN